MGVEGAINRTSVGYLAAVSVLRNDSYTFNNESFVLLLPV